MLNEIIRAPRIAYFSMEIALRNEVPTYAGGLGILAGDMLRSAADLGLPLVAISLASRAGYFRQAIDAQGRQTAGKGALGRVLRRRGLGVRQTGAEAAAYR